MKRDLYVHRSIGLIACALALPASAQTIGGHPSANGKSVMNAGEYLADGQYLVAANRRTFAIQQSDGNLCVYQGSGPNDNQGGLWCTMRYQNLFKPGYNLMSQGDGNLCVYPGRDPSKNKGGGAFWCHMQYGPEGPYFTQLRDDGILCTYKGPNPQTIWAKQWCSVEPSAPKQLGPGVVDINQQTVDWINKDPNRSWQKLTQAIGANPPEGWYIESMKITQLTNTLVDMKMPASQWWPAKSKVLVACAPVEANTTVALSQTVSNSITVSKSNTFDASVSATVSYSGLFVSGSVTATAGYSMTNASQQSDQKDATVSDSTTLSFPKEAGGLTVVLWAKKVTGKGVPWAASFTPKDDQVIEITARRLGRDDRVTGKLPWIQMKTYLPQPWTFKVNGTLDVDTIDPGSGKIAIYPMTKDELAKECDSGPPGTLPPGTYGGSTQSAAIGGITQSAVIGASTSASPGRSNTGRSNARVVERDMPAAELQSKLRNFAPPR
jgi:hypothetical protein